ncbi:MAG: YedE family putative selenium transporter [Desulfobulbaceae bacterium]|nr:YedE family putative selenium transporter [Desulfobulbaceae bacterium]
MKLLRIVDITIITGALLGIGSIILSLYGNPVNSGICVSCFLENVAGSLQLHNDYRMSYLRPELVGFILGSFLMSLSNRRFRVMGGSSPIIRFFLGFFIIVGCAVFIGCPIKMILRLAGGDLTAIAAVAGMLFGIWVGAKYIRGGFRLDREKELPKINGYMMPILATILLVFIVMNPAFIVTADKGPGAARAPMLLALIIGLAIGAVSQKSGLCITGGFRNFFLFRERTLFNGVITVFFSALLFNLVLKYGFNLDVNEQPAFKLGMYGQPASHMEHGWTFLAMTLVGLASVLIDGCPFRQLVKAGQGDVDAGITTLGMLFGSSLAISWALRSTSAGTTFSGKIVVLIGLIFTMSVIMAYRNRIKRPV